MWNRIKRTLFPEKSTTEQLKEQIELAEAFDALQRMAGWEKAVKYLGEEVQGELIESTKYKYEPVRQAVHVTRWDAKRELLDSLLGWMEATQTERDRIIREYKERNLDEHTGTNGD